MQNPIYLIMDFLFAKYGDKAHLRMGVWDESENNFYAVISDDDGSILLGESSYGAATIEEALDNLIGEINQVKQNR